MIESYDPLENPNPDEWLALDEVERILLVEEFHEHAKINLPSVRAHASFHAVIENQLASGDPPQVLDTLERLLGEGLDRHEAIHAISTVLSRVMYNTAKNPSQKLDPTKAYIKGLKELTVEKWLDSGD